MNFGDQTKSFWYDPNRTASSRKQSPLRLHISQTAFQILCVASSVLIREQPTWIVDGDWCWCRGRLCTTSRLDNRRSCTHALSRWTGWRWEENDSETRDATIMPKMLSIGMHPDYHFEIQIILGFLTVNGKPSWIRICIRRGDFGISGFHWETGMPEFKIEIPIESVPWCYNLIESPYSTHSSENGRCFDF